MAHKIFGWILSGAIALNNGASACAFHGYTPNPTLVDVLLATEQAVIARPDPARPSRYIAVETLLGPEAEVSLNIASQHRAPLSRSRDAVMLLARDGAYGPWVEVRLLDPGLRAIVGQVIKRQSAWVWGGDGARLAHFAAYVNDPNPKVRHLALRELDRAPYSDLRQLRLPEIRNLRRDLTGGEADLRPIRALLAGLSRDRAFGDLLAGELDAALRNDLPYMGAYATALIEQWGERGVQLIIARYLTAPRVSAAAKEKLLQALALQHKTARGSTRRMISREMAALLRAHPALEAPAARQFGYETLDPSRQQRPGSGGRQGDQPER